MWARHPAQRFTLCWVAPQRFEIGPAGRQLRADYMALVNGAAVPEVVRPMIQAA